MTDKTDEQSGTRRRRPAGWALGLPAVALVCLAAVLWLTPSLEQEIRRAALGAAEETVGHELARAGVRAEVDGRDVRIVADEPLPDQARTRIAEAIGAIRGVRLVRVEVVSPSPMSPFELTLRRSEGGVSLSGGVPAANLRSALVARAERLVSRDRIDERLRIATGAPPGLAEAAAWLMGLLERASLGEATLSDRAIRLRLETADSPAYQALRAAVASPPAGFAIASAEILPPLATPFAWSVRRNRSELVMSGHVPSEETRARLASLAAHALPKLSFRDEMRVARGLEPGVDLASVAEVALPALASLQAGSAELVGRRLSVSGEAVAKARATETERRLRASLPSRVQVDKVSLTVVPASPYRFTARRADGRVVLAGFMPEGGGQDAIRELAASRFPGERVVDERDPADGAPPGFVEAARLGLETLTNFAEGEAKLSDREIEISGRVIYAQLAARLRDNFPSLLPAGWTGRITIAPVEPENALDPIQCGDLLAEAARRHPIRFEAGKAEPGPASKPAFLATAETLRRCGEVPVRVVHQIAPAKTDPEALRSLAERRAALVVEVLAKLARNAKLSAEGAVAPAGSPDAADRTEFKVLAP